MKLIRRFSSLLVVRNFVCEPKEELIPDPQLKVVGNRDLLYASLVVAVVEGIHKSVPVVVNMGPHRHS